MHMDTPSSMSSANYGRLLPEESSASTSLPLDRGHDVTSDSLDAAESNGLDFHGPTSAIFDGQHLVTRETASVNNVDVSAKAQLFAEAAKQRRLLLLPFSSIRTIALTQPRPTRAH